MRATKKQLLAAIRKCDGFLSEVGKSLRISRQAVAQRVAGDSELQYALAEVEDDLLDAAQSQLAKAVRAGMPWAVKYLLSTKGRKLGYSTNAEVTISGTIEGSYIEILQLPDNGRMPVIDEDAGN